MEIKPTKCNNCPFAVRITDYTDLGMGILLYCNLKRYLGFKTDMLTTYDMLHEEEPPITIPDNCPIKNVDIKISTHD